MITIRVIIIQAHLGLIGGRETGTLISVLSAEGTARLMAFADAVVAIAITLLVLPLVDIPGEASSASVAEIWENHGAQFAMFVLSFVIIARLWLSHHNMGERLARGDPWILLTTLVWLLTVVFLPFPTELLGELGNTRAVSAVYISTLLINVTCLALQGRHLSRRPEMWRDGVTEEQMQVWVAGWWSNPLLTAVALRGLLDPRGRDLGHAVVVPRPAAHSRRAPPFADPTPRGGRRRSALGVSP